MATRQDLERAAAALNEAAQRVITLASQGVTQRPTATELEHAKAYASSAALMRRRAAKYSAAGDEERAKHELERAAMFEARAEVKEVGGRMPCRLRTPAESLARIDELRRAVAELSADLSDVGDAEWEAFLDALAASGYPRDGCSTVRRAEYVTLVGRVLTTLGVAGDEDRTFRPFTLPMDLGL